MEVGRPTKSFCNDVIKPDFTQDPGCPRLKVDGERRNPEDGKSDQDG